VIATKDKDSSDWFRIALLNLKTLWIDVINGHVVYYKGQYLASSDFVKSLSKVLDEWDANN